MNLTHNKGTLPTGDKKHIAVFAKPKSHRLYADVRFMCEKPNFDDQPQNCSLSRKFLLNDACISHIIRNRTNNFHRFF